LQIDWGEVRGMPFTKAGMEGQTRYFFAVRLKYSRYNGYPAPSTHATLTHAMLGRCNPCSRKDREETYC